MPNFTRLMHPVAPVGLRKQKFDANFEFCRVPYPQLFTNQGEICHTRLNPRYTLPCQPRFHFYWCIISPVRHSKPKFNIQCNFVVTPSMGKEKNLSIAYTTLQTLLLLFLPAGVQPTLDPYAEASL